MIAPGEQNAPRETDYRRHMRALEECARKLENMDLDPPEALAVCRQADEHYTAVDRILTGVERELDELRRDRTSRAGD